MSVTQIKNTSFFQPTVISGCQLWMDAVDTSSMTLSGSNVTVWTDKSGNGRNATGGVSPTLATNGITFNGTSQYLATTYSSVPSSESVFVVVTWTGTTNRFYCIIGTSETLGRNYNVLKQSSGINSITWDRWAVGNYAPTPGILADVRFMSSGIYNGSTGTTGLNGGTQSSSAAFTFSGNGITHIGTGVLGDWFTGTIHEIIVYNSALTTTQRQQMEGYLAWKWGLQQSLPSTHPFARTPSFATALYFPKAVPKITGTSGKHPVFMAGLQLWLDAADTTTLTVSGSNVSSWRDKSGNNNNATQPTLANQPTIGTLLNGLNVLDFTGTQPYFSFPTISFTNITVFTIFRNTTLRAYCSPLFIGPFFFFFTDGAGNNLYGTGRLGINGEGIISQAAAGITTTNYLVYSLNLTVGATDIVNFYINGTNAANFNGAASGGRSYYQVGSTDSVGATTGFTAEILVYNGVLNNSQRQEVEGYLAWKWGLQSSLAAGHSYQTLAPIVFPYANPVVRTTNNLRFSPTSIGGCQLWLDAADATSITGTTTVTQWRDKSGNSRHLGALSGTTSYSSNTIQLTNSAMSVSSPVNLTNVIVFIIVKTTGGNNQTVFGGRPNTNVNWSSPDGFGFYMDHQSSIRYYGGEDAAGRTLSFSANTSIPRLFSFQTIGTSVSGRMNGTSQSTGTLSSARTSTAQGFVLGGEWNGSSYGNFIVNASIYEIIVYNSEISIAQLQQVEGYLAWKWALQTSLPTSHLYYKFPAGP